MNSPLFKLNLKDLARGAVVAILAAIFPIVQGALSGGAFDLESVLKVAAGALLGYLAKNFLSVDGKLLGKI